MCIHRLIFTCSLRHVPPFPFSMGLNVTAEDFIFLDRPCSSVHTLLRATWSPAHLSHSLSENVDGCILYWVYLVSAKVYILGGRVESTVYKSKYAY